MIELEHRTEIYVVEGDKRDNVLGGLGRARREVAGFLEASDCVDGDCVCSCGLSSVHVTAVVNGFMYAQMFSCSL